LLVFQKDFHFQSYCTLACICIPSNPQIHRSRARVAACCYPRRHRQRHRPEPSHFVRRSRTSSAHTVPILNSHAITP